MAVLLELAIRNNNKEPNSLTDLQTHFMI